MEGEEGRGAASFSCGGGRKPAPLSFENSFFSPAWYSRPSTTYPPYLPNPGSFSVSCAQSSHCGTLGRLPSCCPAVPMSSPHAKPHPLSESLMTPYFSPGHSCLFPLDLLYPSFITSRTFGLMPIAHTWPCLSTGLNSLKDRAPCFLIAMSPHGPAQGPMGVSQPEACINT